jgi:hypothetical protein
MHYFGYDYYLGDKDGTRYVLETPEGSPPPQDYANVTQITLGRACQLLGEQRRMERQRRGKNNIILPVLFAYYARKASKAFGNFLMDGIR